MKPNYYAILTSEVRYNQNLTPNAKLLYAEITALINMNGVCFASNSYFANLYGKSKTTVSKWVSELVKEGFVEVKLTYKEGSKEIDNRYITITKGGDRKKSVNPLVKKLKDNNTINNTNITYSNSITFIEEVNSFDYPKEIKDEFISYWTEPNRSKTKVRYQLEKTFDISRRLATWFKRSKKWSNGTSKIDKQLSSYEKAINIIKNNYDKEN